MWQKALQLSGGGGGTPKEWSGTKSTPYNTKVTVDVGFRPLALYASQGKDGFNGVPGETNRITYLEANGTGHLYAQQGSINMSPYYVVNFTDTGFEFTNNAGNYIYDTEFIVAGV